MKFVISSSSLLSTLSTASKVISSKNTLPILDYFLFDIKSDGLHVTASDLETTITTVVTPDSVESEGVIAAPVKLLIDSLKEFSEQPLTFEAEETTSVPCTHLRAHETRHALVCRLQPENKTRL